MTTCTHCGTHLWVGSTDCPTCDPSPVPAGRAAAVRMPGPTVPVPASEPGAGAELVAAAPLRAQAGVVAGMSVLTTFDAGDGGDGADPPGGSDAVRPRRRPRHREMVGALAAAGAIAVLSLLASVPPADDARSTTAELQARLTEDGVPAVQARCIANALVGGLDDEEWRSLDAAAPAGIPHALRAKVASLTGRC